MKKSLILCFILITFLPFLVFAECDCKGAPTIRNNDAVLQFIGKAVKGQAQHSGWIAYGTLFEVEKWITPQPKILSAYVEGTDGEGGTKKFSETQVVVDGNILSDVCSVKFAVGKKYFVKAERLGFPVIPKTEEKDSGATGAIAERWWAPACFGTKEID